ncbi:MAG: cytochrome c oxidase subunit II [Acidobacteria bacterium]|nr:cytochrome c oxidase subunit II [Acidobacteriota bacterium]
MQPARTATLAAFLSLLGTASHSLAQTVRQTPSIFAPDSTPASHIYHLSIFVLGVTGGIFVVVASLLVYVIVRYRARGPADDSEPAQVYGSAQIELAWTVIPVLIVLVLFLTTTRVILAVQDAPKPPAAVEVTVTGHQFWWEFRYPKLGIVTANELHVPVSDARSSKPTYLRLLSADVVHSFWVPALNGKTDLIPNRVNETWIDPQHTGLYVGQCAQYCGLEHARMLLRVYVDSPADFQNWVRTQQSVASQQAGVSAGREVFESEACSNCHTISGTSADGAFGPDLSHLMSRATIASGAALNTRQNLRAWIKDPDSLKPGCLMPAMKLTDREIDQVVDYLSTLQ